LPAEANLLSEQLPIPLLPFYKSFLFERSLLFSKIHKWNKNVKPKLEVSSPNGAQPI